MLRALIIPVGDPDVKRIAADKNPSGKAPLTASEMKKIGQPIFSRTRR
jgi:hypothetical protein